MSRSRISVLVALLLASVGLCAMDGAPTLTYNPNHYQNNDPKWDLLDQAEVTADTKKGEYKVVFPTLLSAQEGKAFKISGFILPLEATSQSAHFMLVRRNTGCPFCPPNAPTEAVEVFAQAPIKYTGEEIAVMGRLKLITTSADGLFFRLDAAAVSASRP